MGPEIHRGLIVYIPVFFCLNHVRFLSWEIIFQYHGSLRAETSHVLHWQMSCVQIFCAQASCLRGFLLAVLRDVFSPCLDLGFCALGSPGQHLYCPNHS